MNPKALARLDDNGIYSASDVDKECGREIGDYARKLAGIRTHGPVRAPRQRSEAQVIQMPDRRGVSFGGRLGDRIRFAVGQ